MLNCEAWLLDIEEQVGAQGMIPLNSHYVRSLI